MAIALTLWRASRAPTAEPGGAPRRGIGLLVGRIPCSTHATLAGRLEPFALQRVSDAQPFSGTLRCANADPTQSHSPWRGTSRSHRDLSSVHGPATALLTARHQPFSRFFRAASSASMSSSLARSFDWTGAAGWRELGGRGDAERTDAGATRTSCRTSSTSASSPHLVQTIRRWLIEKRSTKNTWTRSFTSHSRHWVTHSHSSQRRCTSRPPDMGLVRPVSEDHPHSPTLCGCRMNYPMHGSRSYSKNAAPSRPASSEAYAGEIACRWPPARGAGPTAMSVTRGRGLAGKCTGARARRRRSPQALASATLVRDSAPAPPQSLERAP
jgi:hypothetical protein